MQSKTITMMLIGVVCIAPLSYAQPEKEDTSIEDVQKEAEDLLKTIASYTADEKDEAIKAAKDGIDTLNQRIDALEVKVDKNWATMSDAAREKVREDLKVLRKQQNLVSERYGSMKSSSSDAWEHIKTGFSNAYKELEDAWKKAEQEFNSSE